MFPEVFRIGGFFLPTYGLLVATAFLVALWIAGRLGARAGLDKESVLNLGIYCALAGIVGAKALMILLDPSIRDNWREIFSLATLQAAGIFYGGFAVALATAFIYMWRKGLPALKTADAFAPGLALGHSIGRLGCFSAGCCWGVPTHLPWAVTFTNPRANELVGVPLGSPLHPTQLYESLGELIIFAVLYLRFFRPHRDGSIVSLYLVLYGMLRFLVEFVRFHDPQSNPLTGPFSTEQWLSLALVAAGLCYAVFARSRQAITRIDMPVAQSSGARTR
ncbi:MAG TPA: prolipoprotein diacylglyceryl transferase [Bryobacteraceae bacterium]|nr:prolipoprotein diacylglyceryl transferase [Bryobacteraceae bacterium]